MKITKTGNARFPIEGKKSVCVKKFAACSGNSHAPECGLRRNEYPIEAFVQVKKLFFGGIFYFIKNLPKKEIISVLFYA